MATHDIVNLCQSPREIIHPMQRHIASGGKDTYSQSQRMRTSAVWFVAYLMMRSNDSGGNGRFSSSATISSWWTSHCESPHTHAHTQRKQDVSGKVHPHSYKTDISTSSRSAITNQRREVETISLDPWTAFALNGNAYVIEMILQFKQILIATVLTGAINLRQTFNTHESVTFSKPVCLLLQSF